MENDQERKDTAKPMAHSSARKRWLRALMIIIFAALLTGGVVAWRTMQPKLLLPTHIRSQITTFQPYFYYDAVPAGYSLSNSRYDDDFGIVFFTFSKLGRPDITITEQPLPTADPNKLLEGGESIRDAALPGIIRQTEGRYIGIMLDIKRRTMILLNTSDKAEKQDIKDLLKDLEIVT